MCPHGMGAGDGVALGRPSAQAAAFGGAGAAGLRTSLAVSHRMTAAFVGAGFAYIGANGADHAVVGATAGHEAGGQAAKLGAIDVESDAPGHRPGLGLFETTYGAVVASDRAGVAGFDAGEVVVMGHEGLHSKSGRVNDRVRDNGASGVP